MKEKEKEKGVYLRHVLAASAPFVGINDVIIATFVELVYQAEYLLPQLIERMDDIRSPLGRPMWCVVCGVFLFYDWWIVYYWLLPQLHPRN